MMISAKVRLRGTQNGRAFKVQTEVLDLQGGFETSYLIGGFLFMNISMAFSSSGSTTTSVSLSAASAAPAAPRADHSSSESAS